MLEKPDSDSRDLINALELGFTLENQTQSNPWRWIVCAIAFSLLVNVMLFYYFSNVYVGFKHAYRPVNSAITYEITLTSDKSLREVTPLEEEEPVVNESIVKQEKTVTKEETLNKEILETHSENMTSEKIASKSKMVAAKPEDLSDIGLPVPDIKDQKLVEKAENNKVQIAPDFQANEQQNGKSILTTEGESSFGVVRQEQSDHANYTTALKTYELGLINRETKSHKYDGELNASKGNSSLKIPEKFLAKMGNIEMLDDASLKETTISEPFNEQEAKRIRIFNKYLREMITQVNQYFNKPTTSSAVANGLINFEIDPEGYLVDSYIYRSSGSVLLDQSALQALRSVKKFKVPESRKIVAKYYRYLNLSYNDKETSVEEAPWEVAKGSTSN